MKRSRDVPPDKYFYARDGTVIRNYEELFRELQDMPKHVFEHHVNEERNDFYNWIKDVHGDFVLARNVKDAREKEEVLRHVFVKLFQ